MGKSENAKKNIEMAARMKRLGITRSSGSCPMGCGAYIKNGGQVLIAHLGRCTGKH